MASLLKTPIEMVKEAFSGSSKFNKRLITVGTRDSSKTTVLGCLSLTCDLKSAQDKNFTHFINEVVGGMRKVPSELCQGYFPEQTPQGFIYEAEEVMKWKTSFGEKTVTLGFAETAGQDIESLIGPYRKSMYEQAPTYKNAEVLNQIICDSHGYIITVPVSRARMRLPQVVDKEPDSLLADPDVNISRILAKIFAHKKKSRSPPIEGIAVLLTKYDMVETWLLQRGMNLYEPESARQFLTTYFRQTSALLKYYGLEKVKFFPVFVQVEKTVLPDGSVHFEKWPDGQGDKIIVDEEHNLPSYSMKSYFDLIDWIKDTFAK